MLTPMNDRTTNEWVEPHADECGERNQAQALQGAEHMFGMMKITLDISFDAVWGGTCMSFQKSESN